MLRCNLASRSAAGALLVGAILLHSAASFAEERYHVVASGHTLGKIAKRYHTTVEALREANDLTPRDRLQPGQRLVVPEPGSKPKPKKTATATDTARREPQADRQEPKRDAKKEDRARDPYVKKPKKPGFVKLVRGEERFEGQVLTRRDRLNVKTLPGITKLLRYPTGAKHAINPRLVTLLGMVSNRFGGRTIEVVSGYRPYSSRQYTPHSNHNVGRAIDFRVVGVPNEVVRDYCRTFRDVGVGYYPNSSFVHLDVRTERTYWVDYSRPGERPRYNSQQEELAADESAADVEVYEGPASPFSVPTGDPYGSTETQAGQKKLP